MTYHNAKYEAGKQLAQIIKNKIDDSTAIVGLDNGMIALIDQGEIIHNYFVQELDNKFVVRNSEILGYEIVESHVLAEIEFD